MRKQAAETGKEFQDAWSDRADEEESDVGSFYESSDQAQGLALQQAAEQSSSSDSEENLQKGRSTRDVRVLSNRA